MGMSFPLLAAGTTSEGDRLSGRLGKLYAGNTLGCVVGAFLAGFVLIPALGIQATFVVLAGSTLVAGLIALGLAQQPPLHWRGAYAGVVLLLGIAAWQHLPRSGFLKESIQDPRQLVYYQEGSNGTVSVIREPGGVSHVLVDSQPVAGTGPTDVVDQKMLAHLPLLLHPEPRRALTVGFGSGGTSHSMSLHGVAVDCVEIEPAVPAAARHFVSENHGILGKRGFTLILDDARSWLRVAPTPYDVIVTDCTNVQYKSNGDLYTREYFELMRRQLAERGVAAAWVPANGIEEPDLKMLLRSFQAVFPHTSVWHMNCLPTDFLIVVGTPGPLEIDLQCWAMRMAHLEVSQDLERVGLASPCRLLYTFLLAEDDLRRYLGPGPLNTDDRPLLSYTTYGACYRKTIARNLIQLLTCRGDVSRFVRNAPDKETLLRHQVASNEALLGHVALLAGSRNDALLHYVAGARLLPGDAALHGLVVGLYSQGKRDAPP
jgi:spermidine synthase